MADDMRVDDLQWAPRTRRLFERTGISFENSFSPYPLCCPARASFLTGQYAHNHGVFWHQAPEGYGAFDDSRTLATSMRRAGYATAYVGKYLNGYGTRAHPSLVSGEPSHTYVPKGWDDWRASVDSDGTGLFSGSTYDFTNLAVNDNGAVESHPGEYSTEVIGDLTLEMTEDLTRRREEKGKPFLAVVNHVAPHYGEPRDPDDPAPQVVGGRRFDYVTPYVAPQYRGIYDDVIDRPVGYVEGETGAEPDLSDKPSWVRKLPPTTEADFAALTEMTRQRAESVHAMDRQVHRLVRALKRSGEWSRTVLVVTSDNGFLLGEHRFRGNKVWAYEPSLRVPLLVTGPGMRGIGEHGHERYDPVTTVDLTATILDLGEARAPHPADGRSVLPALRDGDRGWGSAVVTEATHTSFGRDPRFGARSSIGLRTARWSMTRYANGDGELYDLVADPLQLTSVWDDADHRAVRRDLNAVWRSMRSCAAEGCRQPLPDSLSADPGQTRRWTEDYWAGIEAAYSYR